MNLLRWNTDSMYVPFCPPSKEKHELKVWDFPYATGDAWVSPTGCGYSLLPQVYAPSTSLSSFIGSGFYIKSVDIKYNGTLVMNYGSPPKPFSVRLLLVIDKSFNNRTSTWSFLDLIDTSLDPLNVWYFPYAPLNLANRSRFKVLVDQLVPLTLTGDPSFTFEYHKAMNLHILSNSSGYSKNALIFLAIPSCNAGGFYTQGRTFRVRYSESPDPADKKILTFRRLQRHLRRWDEDDEDPSSSSSSLDLSSSSSSRSSSSNFTNSSSSSSEPPPLIRPPKRPPVIVVAKPVVDTRTAKERLLDEEKIPYGPVDPRPEPPPAPPGFEYPKRMPKRRWFQRIYDNVGAGAIYAGAGLVAAAAGYYYNYARNRAIPTVTRTHTPPNAAMETFTRLTTPPRVVQSQPDTYWRTFVRAGRRYRRLYDAVTGRFVSGPKKEL